MVYNSIFGLDARKLIQIYRCVYVLWRFLNTSRELQILLSHYLILNLQEIVFLGTTILTQWVAQFQLVKIEKVNNIIATQGWATDRQVNLIVSYVLASLFFLWIIILFNEVYCIFKQHISWRHLCKERDASYISNFRKI